MVDVLPLLESHEIESTIPIDLSWSNLSCTVKSKKGNRPILKDVSGHAYHKEFLVIMGSSGAGKTTLLNILSDKLRRSTSIEISGQVKANSQPISTFLFNNYIGYVTQEDVLIESMTVFECLLFVAKLKTTYRDKTEKVHALLKELNLETCKYSMIGGPFISGISGGEKKRTCIGMELITNPSILFLDEPTSGLDSYTAMLVCKLLVHQASLGKTIISTIHQPSSDIFYLFDKLMLMTDGRVVYSGSAKESVKVIADAGFVCPSLSNPADYFMEILHLENCNEISKKELEVIEKLEKICKARNITEKGLSLELGCDGKNYKTGFFYQLWVLTHRNMIRLIRNPIMNVLRLIILLSTALIVDYFFWDIGTLGLKAMNNRCGLIFFILSFTNFCDVLTCVLALPSMRHIVLKEYHSNMYGILPYFLSLNIGDFLYGIVSTLIFVSSIYWGVGLNTNSTQTIIEFYVITYVGFLSADAIGTLCGSICAKPDLAMASTIIPVLPAMYFAGFYRSGMLPQALRWVEHSSNCFYLYQAYMLNQFKDLELEDCYTCRDPEHCIPCDPLVSFNITYSLAESLMALVVIILIYRMLTLVALQAYVKLNRY